MGFEHRDTTAFPKEPKTVREAAKTALREAVHQLEGEDPALALIFIGGDSMELSTGDLQHLLTEDSHTAVNFPILAFQCQTCMVRPSDRGLVTGQNIVAALAVPQ